MDTLAHGSIRHCLAMLAPFSPHSTASPEGQRQLYDWFVSFYQAMLENPEAFGVFPAPYEEYMKKNQVRLEEKRGEKRHYSDSRESTLRNTIQQAIQFCAQYLFQLGLAALPGESTSSHLILTSQAHGQVLANMNRMHGASDHPLRYAALEKMHLNCRESDGRVLISFSGLPKAMEGLMLLCSAEENKFKWMNFLRLDFKNAGKAPSFSDVLCSLPQSYQEKILLMEERVQSLYPRCKMKIRPLRGITSDFEWKVEFSHKGKNVWGFYADHDNLKICLYLNAPENISRIADRLMEEDPTLLSWYQKNFPERLCICRYNRAVHLGDIKRRICGLSNRMDMNHPSEKDIAYAAQILDQVFRSHHP